MLNGGTSGARAARYAVVTGVAAVVVAAAVFAWSYLGGSRPEEAVARDFLTAFFAGEGASAYRLTTPGYRTVVLREELERLSEAVADVAGDETTITILGSERTPGSQPPESLVGYSASTAAGSAEGVVTLFEVAGDWRVADVGYGFPEAPPERLRDLRTLTRQLNEQLQERIRRLDGTRVPTPEAPAPG